MVDRAKNKFTAWAPVRELERKLIDKILACRCHIIATMRSKTEWDTSQTDKNGKIKPEKIGTTPIQTNGIEFEFDLAGEMNQQHVLYISKSRCPALADRSFLNPGKELADELKAWIAPLPWSNWQTEDDAIVWAAKELGDSLSLEELQSEWQALETVNGKKSVVWVERIKALKKF